MQKLFRKILVCQLHQIGDVLLATPAIRMLKKGFPEAEIDVFTEKKCLPVLENNPHIHTIHALDKKSGHLEWLKLLWHIRSTPYDLIVDFQQLPRIRQILYFSKVPMRISYSPPWYNRMLYTHWRDNDQGYAALSKASLLRLLDLEWDGKPPELFITKQETHDARLLLSEAGITADHMVISVDASHRRETRRWPAEHYAKWIALTAEAFPKSRFVLHYGPGEETLIQHIASLSGREDVCLITPEMLTLREMAAVISLCRIHVGNCSSPRHFAAALGVPSLVVQGATSSVGWCFPSESHQTVVAGLECQHCNTNTCSRELACLYAVTPEMMLERLQAMLSLPAMNKA